jgi:hypothetical protein
MLLRTLHMRNHTSHLVIAVAAAALVAACGEGNNPDHGRYATESGRGSGAAAQNIKIDGCVAPGSRPDGDFILREVVLPAPATQPNGQETMQNPPIANGTWVRLVGSKDADLASYLGKRVEVIGTIRDSGVNTLGTSGHAGTDKDKFERSGRDAGTSPVRNIPPTTAAPNGGDANGTAPRLSVEHVKKLSDSCEGGENK